MRFPSRPIVRCLGALNSETAEVSEFSLAISFLIDGTVVRVGSVGPAFSCPELKAPSPWFNTSAPIFNPLAGRFGWLE